jgi:peroxiredoxin
VAISVDSPEVSRDLSKKAGYAFSILSDQNAEVIRRYDLLTWVAGLTGMTLPGPQSCWWTRREWCVGSTSLKNVRVRARADEMLAAAAKGPR